MIFTRSRDNLLRTATLSLSAGTEVVGYELAKLHDEHWGVPFQIAETTLDLRIDLGAAVRPGWVILGNSNLTVAARLQGHSDTATWGGTTDVDVSFAVPVRAVDGFFTSPHLVPPAPACRYWRLTVTSNADPVIVGELVFAATRRSLECDWVRPGALGATSFLTVQHMTPYGIDLTYSTGPRREGVEGSLVVDGAEVAALDGLLQSARGAARPFWVQSPLVSSDAWQVRFLGVERSEADLIAPGAQVRSFPIRMVSRGLPWVDPDA